MAYCMGNMVHFHIMFCFNRAAYFASCTEAPSTPPMRSHPLPLFLESASSPVTVAHVMKLSVTVTNYLNPGQIPILETDQPLYTIAKKLQWKFPDESFAEGKLFVSLGGLHIEKMLWAMSGEWHSGCGITTVFTNSGVVNSGTAQSILICSNITRTRFHKQMYVLALELLKQKAYQEYLKGFSNSAEDCREERGDEQTRSPLNCEDWLEQLCKAQPQADYYNKCQELDLLILEVSMTYCGVYNG